MADKTWKRRERDVAATLGGVRIPVTGERAGSDVDTPLLCVQVKHGRRRPAFLREWLDGICAAAKRKRRTGMVVWLSPGERVRDGLVIMKLSDFEDLHGRVAIPTLEQARATDAP